MSTQVNHGEAKLGASTRGQTLLAIGIGLLICCGLALTIGLQWPDSQLHMVVCDVGQGDSILFTYGTYQLLVDAGPNNQRAAGCVQRYLPFWDRTLELVVATHPDADHIGGMPSVLERYHVERLLLLPITKETADFAQFYQAILRAQAAGTELLTPVAQRQWWLVGDIKLTELYPTVSCVSNTPTNRSLLTSPPEQLLWDCQWRNPTVSQVPLDDYNNRSIVLLLELLNFSVLLTGDAENPVELALAQARLLKPVTLLKIAHHGSKFATGKQLLDAISPELAVVSVGKNNSYGHPHASVLNRLAQRGIPLWRTDVVGDIHIVSDGRSPPRCVNCPPIISSVVK